MPGVAAKEVPAGKAGKTAPKGAKAKPAAWVDKKSVFETSEWQVQTVLKADSPFGTAYVLRHVNDTVDKKDPKVHTVTAAADDRRLLMKEFITTSLEDAQAHRATMETRAKLDHAHILRLHDWSGTLKSDWCSTFYKFKAFYQWPSSSLKERVSGLGGKPVHHEELTHVMYQMLDALCHIHTQGHAFNDVRPEYVGKVGTDLHCWALSDRLRFPGTAVQSQRENFQAIFGSKAPARRFYAAPEVLAAVLASQKTAAKVDEKKADMWSFGLMLLSCGLGQPVAAHNQMYKKPAGGKGGYTVDWPSVEKHIEQFKAHYEKDSNSLLGLVVEACLKMNPAERIGPCELLKDHLPPYEEVIEYFTNGGWGRTKHVDPPREVEVVHEVKPAPPRASHVGEVRVIRGEPRIIRRDPVITSHVERGDAVRISHQPHVHVEHNHVHTHADGTTHAHDVVVEDVEQRVVRREPVVVRRSHVAHTHVDPVVHHHDVCVEDTKVIRASHSERGEVRVVRGEPRVVRRDPVVVSNVGHSHVDAHVHHVVDDHRVVRASHTDRSEVRVVRGEPRVVRGDAHVVRGDAHVHRSEARVVRGEARVVRGDAHVVRGDAHVVSDLHHVHVENTVHQHADGTVHRHDVVVADD